MTRRPFRPTAPRLLVATLAALAVPAGTGHAAPAERPQAPPVPAEASLVVDAESGAVISAEDEDERLPIASTTKLMTALLTLERADLDDVFVAAGYQAAPIESQIDLGDGERMAVRDLLVALLLESANDAAVTLAEGIEGSSRAFVGEMNRRAASLGLDETSYANPIGFDHPDNYSTAADLADLAQRLMRDRRFRDIVEESRLPLESGDRPRVVENRNDLVGAVPIVDGIKTGHTLGAGHVLVGSAAEDGNRVISVVLGAPSEAARDAASVDLLRFGLDQFRERRIVRAGEPLGRAEVVDHEGEPVALEAAEPVSLTILRGDRVETQVDAPGELEGPLPAGEKVGSAAVVHRGEVVDRVAVVTAGPVPAPDLLTRLATTLGDHLALVIATAAVLLGAATLAVASVRRRRRNRVLA